MLANKDVDEEGDVKDNSVLQDFATRWIVIRIRKIALENIFQP